MLAVSRKYELIVRNNPSAYLKANKTVVVPGAKIIGSSVSGVAKMISLSEESKVLMPSILSLSPTSPDWDKRLKNYWDSLSHPINPAGDTLETGFIYNITDVSRLQYLQEINKQRELNKQTPLTTDEDLKNYIYDRLASVERDYEKAILEANKLSERDKEDAVKLAYDAKYNSIWSIESEHYKVGIPINAFQYLLWKYCLVYGDVANEVAFANKSTKIRFYLSSENARNEVEARRLDTKKQAMEAYLKIISDRTSVINLLFAMGLGTDISDIAKSAKSKEDLDLQLHILLQSNMDKDPAKFISTYSDKNITIKGLIEKYVAYNILKRVQGTNIIVDYNDGSKIIGNDMNAAVTFFSNQENKAVLSEYETKFKDLNAHLDTSVKKVEVQPPQTQVKAESTDQGNKS